MNVPEGCRESVQISFIEEMEKRPDPTFMWVIYIIKKNGDRVSTCRQTLDDSFEFAKKEMG